MSPPAVDTEVTTTYRDFSGQRSARRELRRLARNAAIFFMSLGKSLSSGSGWIAFPYYHHVFDDERRGFESQLEYLQRFADFISLDDAVDAISGSNTISGRYFCLTFDDGYKNCLTNAAPILNSLGIPATIYVSTALVGTTEAAPLPHGSPTSGPVKRVEYLSWDECRELEASGISIESHSVSHRRIADLTRNEALEELSRSRETIKSELRKEPSHFCCPFGIPGRDFTDRDVELARSAGYRSFATGRRGKMFGGDNPYFIKRHHLLAGWGMYQIRYFMSSA